MHQRLNNPISGGVQTSKNPVAFRIKGIKKRREYFPKIKIQAK